MLDKDTLELVNKIANKALPQSLANFNRLIKEAEIKGDKEAAIILKEAMEKVKTGEIGINELTTFQENLFNKLIAVQKK